jgi:hypothetical protein
MVIDKPRLPGVFAPGGFHTAKCRLPEGEQTMRVAWS